MTELDHGYLIESAAQSLLTSFQEQSTDLAIAYSLRSIAASLLAAEVRQSEKESNVK